jgi:uncharacterized protein (TIGR02679 family)
MDERLQRLMGGDALAGLRARLRGAYERAPAGEPPPVLRLAHLAAHEREALAALSGRPPREAASIRLDVAALGRQLRAAGLAEDLWDALQRLDGPLRALAAERAEGAAAWAALVRDETHPALRGWLALPAGRGLLKRLAGGDAEAAHQLCAQVRAVLGALPAPGWPRARLAAATLGDAHALDDGRPTATLVLALLRQARGADAEDDEDRRALWAAAGVSVNELARPALALNLPGGPQGEPAYWSLRRLLRDAPSRALAGRTVFVCENPNVVAIAADALGERAAPLACTEGMPAAAQRTLLGQLRRAGAVLRHHGDFDWPGIAIANLVRREFGALPWRMETADYEAALAGHAGLAAPLAGAAVAPAWSDTLGPAMQRRGRSLAEEALADSLIQDLASR